jgi:hypothetical protein
MASAAQMPWLPAGEIGPDAAVVLAKVPWVCQCPETAWVALQAQAERIRLQNAHG